MHVLDDTAAAEARSTTPALPSLAEGGLVEERWFGPTEPFPSALQLAVWEEAGVAHAIDGCTVPLDGTCEHLCPSWFLYLESP